MIGNPNNNRRKIIEAQQREARRLDNEARAAMIRRLFPSLNGPAFQRVTPPSKED